MKIGRLFFFVPVVFYSSILLIIPAKFNFSLPIHGGILLFVTGCQPQGSKRIL